MNILFLAKHPEIFIELALRLEKNNIPFWAADNLNDFHHMLSRISIDIVFADYNFTNFKDFDVYKHFAKKRPNLVFLFINKPDAPGNLFIQWEDQINENTPHLWSHEVEQCLRIIADQPLSVEYVYKPASIQDLLTKMEVISPVGSFEEQSREDLPSVVGALAGKADDFAMVDAGSGKEGVAAVENKFLENFLIAKQNGNLTFLEYVLFDLFQRRKNEIVDMTDMVRALDIPHDARGINRIYRYIHRIRNFLQQRNRQDVSLVRVKKGCYSLVSRN